MTNSQMTSGNSGEADVKRLLESFADCQIVQEYGKKLDATPIPDLIYHYTDDKGLRGIFEHGTLWFTNIFTLNDPSEIRHGVSYACHLLSKAASGNGASTKLHRFAEKVTETLNAGVEQSGQFFVCSFSRDDDQLGQWRAYADDGKGYAIGFDTNLLEPAFLKAEPQANGTFPLCYDEAELHSIQAVLVQQVLDIFRLADSALTDQYLEALAYFFSVHVTHSAVFFKHRGYEDEKEYRFMQIFLGERKPSKVQVRTRPHTLVRYLEFEWKTPAAAALKEVVIGPAADPRVAAKYVEDCCRTYLADLHIPSRQSKIPYRSYRKA